VPLHRGHRQERQERDRRVAALAVEVLSGSVNATPPNFAPGTLLQIVIDREQLSR
jgi:hypothetical protein